MVNTYAKEEHSDTDNYLQNIGKVKSVVIKHQRFEEITNELNEIHMLSKKKIACEQLCILGPTGAGKTTLVEDYVRAFKREYKEERTIIPILYVKVPSKARSPKDLASNILRVMGDPLFASGTEINMTHRIQNYIIKCEVEMIILDKFQHLIDRDTKHVLGVASDWLKTFIEEVNIPVVLCGLPESKRIFEYNEQLDGRYTNRFYLLPFSYETQKERTEFRSFLLSVDENLPFPKKSNLADPNIASRIFYFSLGSTRYTMDLIKNATKEALKAKNECITYDNLRDAYYKMKKSNRPYAINPFEINNFELKDEILKEKKKLGVNR